MSTRDGGERLTGVELGAWRGLLRVHSSLIHELDADLLAAHGLSLHSYEVLLLLEDAPGRRLRMTDLSRSALLSASGVSRLVDRLEGDGYVKRMPCPSDGRGSYAALTQAGLAKLREARATHLDGVRRLFLRHFDGEGLRRLAEAWERVLPGAVEDGRHPDRGGRP